MKKAIPVKSGELVLFKDSLGEKRNALSLFLAYLYSEGNLPRPTFSLVVPFLNLPGLTIGENILSSVNLLHGKRFLQENIETYLLKQENPQLIELFHLLAPVLNVHARSLGENDKYLACFLTSLLMRKKHILMDRPEASLGPEELFLVRNTIAYELSRKHCSALVLSDHEILWRPLATRHVTDHSDASFVTEFLEGPSARGENRESKWERVEIFSQHFRKKIA